MKDYFKKNRVLTQINQGNENTFLQMYNYYAPKLFRHIYYRLNSRELAEDIAQQVFYKTWQYITNSTNKIDNLNAFLYKTTNNLITDYYRKSERGNISINNISIELERKISDETSYINDVDHDLETVKVNKSIELLKPEQQKLIIWRYFDDLSISEIAKISGKSKNAVYVGVHRALKDLKKLTIEMYEKI